jgi:hypothetical protein
MLDMIMDLKNNKKRQGQAQAQERGLRLKRWLGTVKSAQGGLAHDTTLRVSWSDLTGDHTVLACSVDYAMLLCVCIARSKLITPWFITAATRIAAVIATADACL